MTDRRTEFSSLYRVCITCSAVKKGGRGGKRGGEEREREGDTRHTNPSLLPAPLAINAVSVTGESRTREAKDRYPASAATAAIGRLPVAD